MSAKRHIAVIGAGLSGLAAALTLLRQGHRVTLFETAAQAGGRARGVLHQDTMVDNGQHLCIGGYHATLALIRDAGLDASQIFARLPLTLHMHDGAHRMSLVTPAWLPAPLHLLWGLCTARGLDFTSKWRAIRWMHTLKQQSFRLANDTTVAALLRQGRQTEVLIKMLWEPLCLAALNTPIQHASAQVFLNVLHDSFQQRRADSDLLIMQSDLSTALIEPLVKRITSLGGEIRLHSPVQAVTCHGHYCQVVTAHAPLTFDHAILAVGPHQCKTITSELPLPAFTYETITTVYLQFSAETRLPHPYMGLCHGLAHWVFDRGQCCAQPGLLAVVISAHQTIAGEKSDWVTQCISEINQALASYGMQLDTPPLWTQVISEKRATFSCTPTLARPGTATPFPTLSLAGDYVDGPYPATIEGAIRNGIAAASRGHSAH